MNELAVVLLPIAAIGLFNAHLFSAVAFRRRRRDFHPREVPRPT